MPINFDRVPQKNPYTIPDRGFYRARIDKADYVIAASTDKKNRIDLTCALLDANKKKVATYYDRLFDSDAPAVLYKIGRLINAVGINLTGNVELKDIAKVLPGKEYVVEMTIEADKREPDNRDKDRAVPRMFGSEIFWPISEASKLIQTEGAATNDDVIQIPFSLTAEAEEIINTQSPTNGDY